MYVPLQGFQDKYLISQEGMIYSKYAGRNIKQEMCPYTGYMRVKLRDSTSGKNLARWVHRLVAQTFKEECDNCEVNHLDGNKLNNKSENLEWTTRLENMRHAHTNGLIQYQRGEQSHSSKLTETEVHNMLQDYTNGETSLQILADKYNVGKISIYKILSGKTWTHVDRSGYKTYVKKKAYSLTKKDKKSIIGDYQKLGSMRKVASKWGITHGTVSRILKRNDIVRHSLKNETQG